MRAAFFSSSPFSVLSSQFGVLHSGRNYDFLRDFLIDWRDVIAMAIMKDADYSRVGAVDWAHDSPLSTAVRPDGAHLDEHAISVHRRAECGRRNENVSGEPGLWPVIQRCGIRQHKAKAIAGHAGARDHMS